MRCEGCYSTALPSSRNLVCGTISHEIHDGIGWWSPVRLRHLGKHSPDSRSSLHHDFCRSLAELLLHYCFTMAVTVTVTVTFTEFLMQGMPSCTYLSCPEHHYSKFIHHILHNTGSTAIHLVTITLIAPWSASNTTQREALKDSQTG